MAATIQEIATRTGLSKPAVSQILNNKPGYKAETRERVLKAAAEMGYRPNEAARAITSGRFGCVALVLGTDFNRSNIPPPFLRGVHDALAKSDWHLTFTMLPDEQLGTEQGLPKILRHWFADGLLLNYTHRIPVHMQELIEKYKLPSIWINSIQKADCVHPDDRGAGEMATQHLLNAGHKDIALVDYSHPLEELSTLHYSATDRMGGYQEAMKAAKLASRVIRPATSNIPGGRVEQIKAWLSRPDRPTAAVVYGNHDGIVLYHTACLLNIKVPEELSIVSFDDAPFELLGRRFSMCQVPSYDVGFEAIELLRKKIEAPVKALPPRALPFTWVHGETIAKPCR